LVVDHFNYDSKSADEKHDVLLLPTAEFARKDIKNYFAVDGLVALPRAVGQLLGNASPHLSPVLRASETAYTYNPKEEADGSEEPFATGSQISLVTAFQAVNSARFTILGSSEALEDAWFDASVQLAGYTSDSKTSNRAFAQKLSAWTFKEAGVLRAGPVTHFLNEGTQKNAANSSNGIFSAGVDVNPGIYRIKNDVYYSIEMSEWVGDHWEPFTPATGDNLQLEFSMLSPFHRLNLIPSSSSAESTLYTQTFKLPDQHGIYNFFVEYRRPFLTNIEEKRTVTVRHFAHDEYPRSYVITGAYPWISGIWVTIGGWLGFVALWLYSKPSQPKADIKLEKKL
jgi:oligosaccharyltransferase complex subunit beta